MTRQIREDNWAVSEIVKKRQNFLGDQLDKKIWFLINMEVFLCLHILKIRNSQKDS